MTDSVERICADGLRLEREHRVTIELGEWGRWGAHASRIAFRAACWCGWREADWHPTPDGCLPGGHLTAIFDPLASRAYALPGPHTVDIPTR